jgi:uncharacterized protein YukE
MRLRSFFIPLLLTASPGIAQAAQPVGPAEPRIITLPPELTDPRTADKLANTVQALSNALLNMPVGDLKAAVEGHPATAAERHMTVRDLARSDDPNFDRKLQQHIAEVRPTIHQSMKTINDALPQVMQGLEQAGKALERAAANMPDPNYPRR